MKTIINIKNNYYSQIILQNEKELSKLFKIISAPTNESNNNKNNIEISGKDEKIFNTHKANTNLCNIYFNSKQST